MSDLVMRLVQATQDSKKESSRQAAHQDTRQGLDGADQSPLFGQNQVAVSGGRVGHGTEVQSRLYAIHCTSPGVEQSPGDDFDQMQQDDPGCKPDKQTGPWPQTWRWLRATPQPAQAARDPGSMNGHAHGHQAQGECQLQHHPSLRLQPGVASLHGVLGGSRYNVIAKVAYTISNNKPTNHADLPLVVTIEAVSVAIRIMA